MEVALLRFGDFMMARNRVVPGMRPEKIPGEKPG
jgi:hypothetical protein